MAVLSHVAYRSGALADMAGLTAAARERGATLIWDLSHSAGAVPVDLRGAGAQLAVGCTYKYLNAGPGAPAYLYVAAELQDALRSPVWGWFGQSEQFAMERDYDPLPGIARFLAGTPPILQLAAVEEGARLTGEAGLDAIRAKSLALTELIVELHDAWLAPLGFELGSPREAGAPRLARLAAPPAAWTFTRALIERQGHARLPRPGLDPARRRAALHELRGGLGRAGPPARDRRPRRPAGRRARRAPASPSAVDPALRARLGSR